MDFFRAYPIKMKGRFLGMGEICFIDKIKSKIKEINDLYKEVYRDYIPNEEELLLKEFLDDIWKPRFEDNKRNEKLYESGIVALLFHGCEEKGVYRKEFQLRKLHPIRESTAPLWFVIYRLAKDNEDYNLYLCPNIIYRGRNNNSALENAVSSSNCYFVDIDEIDTKIPIYNMSETKIKGMLKSKYPVYEEITPKYITMSGRGLHLYFILEHTENLALYNGKSSLRDVHKWMTKDLIELYGADKVCHNLNRFMRIPFSINHKVNIRVRCYKTEDNGAQSLSNLLSVVKKYKVQYKTEKISNPEIVININDVEGTDITRSKKELVKKAVIIDNHGISSLCSQRKRDLEKWLLWHLDDLSGRRHTFFWLYVNNLRNMKCETSYIHNMSYRLNRTLSDPLSDKELDGIIYSGEKVYKVKDETIGEMLFMSAVETMELEGIYTDAEKDRRLALKKEDKEKRREERLKRNQAERIKSYAKYFDYMKSHPENNYKQMALDFGISESYCIKIRRAYKKNVA